MASRLKLRKVAPLFDSESLNLMEFATEEYLAVRQAFRSTEAMSAFPSFVDATELLREVFNDEVGADGGGRAQLAFHHYRNALWEQQDGGNEYQTD